eukprot:2684185-Pyramimonas_sp.AAC.3
MSGETLTGFRRHAVKCTFPKVCRNNNLTDNSFHGFAICPPPAHGHEWFGTDISAAMLEVAHDDREVDGDLALSDMGQGLPLRQAMFDGAISISAIQWLCNADSSGAEPRVRLRRFFSSLYGALTRGARAVLQFYPETPKQAEMITMAAMRAGFSGGLVRLLLINSQET